MPDLRAPLRSGAAARGGIVGHPLDGLFEEVAYIAYHFGWSLDCIMALEHGDRHQFVDHISQLNERANAEARHG